MSYTFDHIWINLLTQCTQLPVSVFWCFCISGFPAIKSAPKIPRKIYKKSAQQKLLESHREGRGATTRQPGGQVARTHPGPPGTLLTASWGPLDTPFAYIYPSGWKPLIRTPLSRSRLCTAAAAVSRSGLPGEAAPAPCRKEELLGFAAENTNFSN